jgi:hypothetical protein
VTNVLLTEVDQCTVDNYHIFFLVVLIEHVLLLLKLWIADAIPDEPQWVLDLLKKEEYRKVQDMINDAIK